MNAYLKMGIYCIISFTILAFTLYLTINKVNKKYSWLVYSTSAILTVIIHYTIIIADYIKYKQLIITDNLVLPMYPCNVIMWLCFILIFFKNKNSFAFNTLCEFISITGTICAFCGIVFNTNFYANPDFTEYEIIKGLISHTTMLFSCLYLIFAKYFKFNYIKNIISQVIGLLMFALIAVWINGIYLALNIPEGNRINVMFFKAPFENLPYLNFLTAVPIALLITFIILKIIDIILKKKAPK